MSQLTDTQVIEWIAHMLRASEWNSGADYLEAIASVVAETGRDLEHPVDCDGCGPWPGGGCCAPDDQPDHSMLKEDRRNAGMLG